MNPFMFRQQRECVAPIAGELPAGGTATIIITTIVTFTGTVVQTTTFIISTLTTITAPTPTLYVNGQTRI
jgi:hypothetical protein